MISLSLSAQSKLFSLNPSYKQTFHLGDTVIATTQLVTNDPNIGQIVWKVISAPNTAILGTPNTSSLNNTLSSSVIVTNPAVGNYVLSATGTSSTGTVGTLTDSLVVLPAIPTCPVPRTVVSYNMIINLINGAWVPKIISFTYSDGTTQ